MGIFYYDEFSRLYGTRNFGDDFNPWFLGKLFSRRILDSPDICLIGIGTLINDRTFRLAGCHPRKVVFSSGVGYGSVDVDFDESWEFACVRGPRSAAALGLPPEKAICDGAILLADLYPALPSSEKRGRVLVPHINTASSSGNALRRLCDRLGWRYLSPAADFDEFVEVIARAELVVTESMHGAIVADTMRTPWLPIEIRFHELFKWQDWFQSVELTHAAFELRPLLWNGPDNWRSMLKRPYLALKQRLAARCLTRIAARNGGFLSDPVVLEARKAALRDVVRDLNARYG